MYGIILLDVYIITMHIIIGILLIIVWFMLNDDIFHTRHDLSPVQNKPLLDTFGGGWIFQQNILRAQSILRSRNRDLVDESNYKMIIDEYNRNAPAVQSNPAATAEDRRTYSPDNPVIKRAVTFKKGSTQPVAIIPTHIDNSNGDMSINNQLIATPPPQVTANDILKSQDKSLVTMDNYGDILVAYQKCILEMRQTKNAAHKYLAICSERNPVVKTAIEFKRKAMRDNKVKINPLFSMLPSKR